MDTGTLSSLETETLRSALDFLFAQAGELLKRRRERGEGKDVEQPPSNEENPVLEGALHPVPDVEISAADLERLAEERRRASDYADGVLSVSAQDPRCVETLEQLRQAVEAALGQHVTFRGETRRPASGTSLAIQGDALQGGSVGSIEVSGERAVGIGSNSGSVNTGDR